MAKAKLATSNVFPNITTMDWSSAIHAFNWAPPSVTNFAKRGTSWTLPLTIASCGSFWRSDIKVFDTNGDIIFSESLPAVFHIPYRNVVPGQLLLIPHLTQFRLEFDHHLLQSLHFGPSTCVGAGCNFPEAARNCFASCNLCNQTLASCKRSSSRNTLLLCQPPLRPGDEGVALIWTSSAGTAAALWALFNSARSASATGPASFAHCFQSFLELLHLLGSCSTGDVRAHTLLVASLVIPAQTDELLVPASEDVNGIDAAAGPTRTVRLATDAKEKQAQNLVVRGSNTTTHFWPASTLLRGHQTLATLSLLVMDPQILERWDCAYEVHRRILVSNCGVTHNNICEFHTLDWFRHVSALPENRLRRASCPVIRNPMVCIR